jgi:hypothetical protein
MGTTYLELTNRVLRKLNEVELTSATFASATGFHALAKDLVVESIDRINKYHLRWPFNHTTGTITCVADTATYAIASGYRMVDWSTMFLEEDAALEVAAQKLPEIDYLQWHNEKRGREQLAVSGAVNVPSNVYRTRDEKIGISPIPDRAYTITYEYWQVPTRLSLYSDTTLIPEEYDSVIVSHAMVGGYRFRENYEMSGVEYRTFEEGIKDMKKVLVPSNMKYAYDTRSNKGHSVNRNNRSK